MKNYIAIVFLVSVFLLQSCNSTKTETFWVNSYKTECDAGAGKMQCLLVNKNIDLENGDWQNFYNNIEGFTFKSGYFQQIKVKVTTLNSDEIPADASSLKYTFMEILNEQKDDRFALNDIWLVQKINGKNITTQTNLPQLEINVAKMQVMGTDGCNNFRGGIKTLTSTEIIFGNLASTRKMCMDMTTTNNFNKALHKTTHYKKENLKLLFFDKDGNEMLVLKKVD
jgi:heat shock protein HslJ